MPDPRLSKASRAWVSTLLVGAVILAGYGCVHWWPVTMVTLDPMQTPFYGPCQANGFVHPSIHNTQGLRRAHKLIVGVAVLGAFLGSLPWWGTALLWRGCSIIKALIARRRQVRRITGSLVLFVLLAVLLAKEIPSLRKTPDFTKYTAAGMAVTNAHLLMTVGHADRLAAGDILFRETTPKYGVLLPVVLAIFERHFGLIALGDLLRTLIGLEILYWIAAGYLFLVWSRGHWLSCLLPALLLLQFYWSATSALIPPNHSPCRTAGLQIAALTLMVLRYASARANHWAGGTTSALAILLNIESGIAATAGLVAYLHYRYTFAGPERRQGGILTIVARFFAGFLAALIGFVLLYRVGCGHWPYAPGLEQYLLYAKLSSMGYGSRPFRIDLYPNAYIALWPLVIVAHSIWTVLFVAQQRSGGFRPSFRLAVGITLLVWFAYFANSPDPGYLCSYLLLYGLLLIDLGRYVGLAFTRPRNFFGIQAVLAAVVLCYAGFLALQVIEWSWNPRAWTVKSSRWAVPLVRRGDPTPPCCQRVSKAYLPQSYVDSLRDRAEYLRGVARGRRVVYFTVDSYLMPRLSRVLPLQEYPDPCEALTKPMYDHLLHFVFEAPVDEVYIDARNAAELIWYGGMFDLLRRDLTQRFHRERVEHGWEVWRRLPDPVSKRRSGKETL